MRRNISYFIGIIMMSCLFLAGCGAEAVFAGDTPMFSQVANVDVEMASDSAILSAAMPVQNDAPVMYAYLVKTSSFALASSRHRTWSHSNGEHYRATYESHDPASLNTHKAPFLPGYKDRPAW